MQTSRISGMQETNRLHRLGLHLRPVGAAAGSGPLDGRVAIVTGGAGGIGAAIAKAFAAAGAKVVVASRTKANLDAVAAEIAGAGGTAAAVVCDVTVEEQVCSLVAQTVSRFGKLDVMVNNSGGARNMGRPEEYSGQGWADEIALNLHSVFYGSQQGETDIRGSGGSLKPPGPLRLMRLHTVHMEYSECFPTLLHPLAERTSFPQARRRRRSR
jgi:hypothetical protein